MNNAKPVTWVIGTKHHIDPAAGVFANCQWVRDAYKASVRLSPHSSKTAKKISFVLITIHIHVKYLLSYSSTDLPLHFWPLLQRYGW